MHGRQARVYWSQHFSQLVDVEALMLAGKTPRGESK
jgi:hypothetical protein